MYTHAHVFPVEHWAACIDVRRGDEGWKAFLARNRANLIVVEIQSHEELCEQLRSDPDWQVIQDVPQAGPLSVLIAMRKKPL